MTLRDIEMELWQEFGRTAGIPPEQVESAVTRARQADAIMDDVIPPEHVAAVRARLSEIINENIFLFTRKN